MKKNTILAYSLYYIIALAICILLLLRDRSDNASAEAVQSEEKQTPPEAVIPQDKSLELELTHQRLLKRHEELRLETIDLETEIQKKNKQLSELKSSLHEDFSFSHEKRLEEQLASLQQRYTETEDEIARLKTAIKAEEQTLGTYYNNYSNWKMKLKNEGKVSE